MPPGPGEAGEHGPASTPEPLVPPRYEPIGDQASAPAPSNKKVRRRVGSLEALGHRDFALLWSGQAVSLLGDGIFTVALALEALRLSKGPYALSFVLAARLVPTVVFLVVSGALIDRLPRRLVLLVSDAVRGAAVLAIAVLTAVHELRVWHLVVMALVFGTADAFFLPASTAIVPELVPAELLTSAAALESSSWVAAQNLIGPAVGGILVAALGSALSFGADAASFAVSATCIGAMRLRPRPAPSGRSILHDVRAGMAYVRSQRWLWATILAAAVANFAGFAPTGVLLPLLIRRTLGAGPAALGFVLAAGGLGGLVGALAVGRFGAPRRRITAMWLSWGLSNLALIGMGVSPNLWVLGAMSAVGFALLMYGGTLWNPIMQQLVPAEMLGRASSVDWLVSLSLTPAGVLAAGATAAVFGPRTALVACGIIASSMTLVLLVPGVREPERSDNFSS